MEKAVFRIKSIKIMEKWKRKLVQSAMGDSIYFPAKTGYN